MVVSENTIGGINQEGIYLSLSLNSKIAHNKLANGVHIENSSGNILADNEFVGSDMVMYYSQNTLISGNQFSNSWNTLQIHDSSELTAAANNFKDCYMPISTSGTSGIIVYMNNFINYTYPPVIHPDTDSSGNTIYRIEVWDNGQVGNYWSNYTQASPHAKQVGSSGTWDTPYEFCPKNADNHPLVSPVSSESMQTLSQTLVSQHKPSENADTAKAILLVLNSPITITVIVLVVTAIAALLLLKFKAKRRKKLVESGPGGI